MKVAHSTIGLTEKDLVDLRFALELGCEWIALSFVQRPEDVVEARRLIGDRAHVLVKVEKPSALDRIDEIVAAADAVMVARGDLGVEMPPEEVPVAQKTIIRTCRDAGRSGFRSACAVTSFFSRATDRTRFRKNVFPEP